ncbi:winged helix-turn-helix transcriptional regulator [Verrucomicrobiaceae bacterium N1E253]|uniref:Winged helix-turn-helix transcriptional regulator n=1 Tax=Oceaniferula marina TaxID=2748318 RepID=A0A851GM13_9BACT|nr:metalloregulator ArsR/SmtB family transcription factor [Oceaniferula marina]NWK55830.1 winged helix-turn-helix transcriptional regulator [Oceaniferula marina]
MHDELKLIKALADGNRLRVVAALSRYQELCACQITELLQVSGATTSRHLAILQDAGLASSRKDGRWVYFSLSRPKGSASLFQWLNQSLSSSETWHSDTETLKLIMAMTPEDLCRRQRGEVCCPA